jgi:DNA-binding transcriptional ArsR family regulator
MGNGVERGELSEAEIEAVLRKLELVRGAAQVRQKRGWTVGELYQAALPARIWIVPELLPAGLASLAGRPKMGKSMLALQLAAAVGLGRPFLGYELQAGPVLFLALEDSLQRLQERLQRLGVTESAPMQFYTEWAALSPGGGGLRDLKQCVAEMQPRLVVIDTLSRALWGAVSRAEQVSATLTALQWLAQRHNCCVLTIDHHRKDERRGDAVDDLLGQTSKAAALDTVWGLYGGRGERGVSLRPRQSTARLRVTGREVAPCELALEFDPGSGMWQLGAEPYVASKETAMMEVGRALARLGGVATTSEIAKALGMRAANVSRALARLLAAGQVRRLPREGHRVPYEWVG